MRFAAFYCMLNLLMLLSACTPAVDTRGMMIDHDRLASLVVGTSTRENVSAQLGSPTFVSTFDAKKWYYVGQRTEQVAFYSPTLVEQKGIVITFSDKGTVSSILPLDSTKIVDVAPVERSTPTYGQDNTLIQQLLGNLSRPVPSGLNKQH